jgi:cation diffusion facilitator CzcD-associated flavoprotein CzcO
MDFNFIPAWSQNFCRQEEILAYLQGLAIKNDLHSNARFRHSVLKLIWNTKLKKMDRGHT